MDSKDAYPPHHHPIDILRFVGARISSATRVQPGEVAPPRADIALLRLICACLLGVFVIIAFLLQGLVAIGLNAMTLPWGFGFNPLARKMDDFVFSLHAIRDSRLVLHPMGIFCHLAAVLIVLGDYTFASGEARWYALMAVSALPALMAMLVVMLAGCTLYSSIRFSLPVMRLLKELPRRATSQ